MSGDARRHDGVRPWVAFGSELRNLRRRAGLTQLQLGDLVGYHHSLISKLESGLREPPAGLGGRLDALLGADGTLAEAAAAPRQDRRTGIPLADASRTLFAPLPGGQGPGTGVPFDAQSWPGTLPDWGVICPLHAAVGCAVPEPSAVLTLLKSPEALHASSGPDAVHGLTALLGCFARAADEGLPGDALETVERVLHQVVQWAEAVNASGRMPDAQLRLAANYAQLAGQMRMYKGQTAVSSAWFGHGLRWACASDDIVTQAMLLCDISTLLRLDRDPVSALVYAQAIGALDSRRGWVATLGHLYQARGYALGQDAAECRRHITQARRRLVRLDQRDRAEAPWLAGADGEMRIESAVGGALRDLAAGSGDRATARRAVSATRDSLTHLKPWMRPAKVLFTLRLADSYACADDLESALAVATDVLAQAARTERATTVQELRGLHARLTGRWGHLPQISDFRERLREAAGRPGPRSAARGSAGTVVGTGAVVGTGEAAGTGEVADTGEVAGI